VRRRIWSQSEWCEGTRAMGAAWSGVSLFICCLLPLLAVWQPPPTTKEAWAVGVRFVQQNASPPLDCVLLAKIDVRRLHY